MKKKRGVLWLLVLVLVSFAASANEIHLTLKDSNNDFIDNVLVNVEVNGNTITRYVDDKEVLRFELGSGVHELKIKVDDPATEGKDYYAKVTLDVTQAVVDEVFLESTGSLKGIVKGVLDNIVPNAQIRLDCLDETYQTTEVGSFYIDHVPTGDCKIYASYKAGVGMNNVNLNVGEIQDIEIKLDKTILIYDEKNYPLFTFILVALIAAAVVLIIVFRKKKSERVAEKVEGASPKERAKTIFKTLNLKEKNVVNSLIVQGHSSTQANIRHNTGIPRTSLARVLKNLEQKNIIEIRKEGKAVKVGLTKWFIGEE